MSREWRDEGSGGDGMRSDADQVAHSFVRGLIAQGAPPLADRMDGCEAALR